MKFAQQEKITINDNIQSNKLKLIIYQTNKKKENLLNCAKNEQKFRKRQKIKKTHTDSIDLTYMTNNFKLNNSKQSQQFISSFNIVYNQAVQNWQQMSNQIIQNYQKYIKSLQSQITSRQNQRKKMEQEIQNFTNIINKERQHNKELKDYNAVLMNDNSQIFRQLQIKERALAQQGQIIHQYQQINVKNKQKIATLEIEKSTINAELKAMRESSQNKNTQLSIYNTKLKQFQSQTKKNLSLIDGYKQLLGQKSISLSRLNNDVAKLQNQLKIKQQAYSQLRTKFDQNVKTIEQYRTSSMNKQLNLGKSNRAIEQMKQQIINLKVFHEDQIKTLNFHHTQQKNCLEAEKSQLNQKINELNQKMLQLEKNQTTEKTALQKYCSQKQDVIKQLIEQINYLKGQTLHLKQKQSLKEQEITQNVLKMGLQFTVLKKKAEAAEQQVKELQKEIQRLKQQSQKAQKNKAKLIQQKQSQLENIKNARQKLQVKTIQYEKQIQALNQNVKQLKEDKKRMTLQFNQHSHESQQSKKILQSQGESMRKLNQLFNQSKKINEELSTLLNLKTKQIQALEQNNHMLRKEKIQYLNNQQQYRKKIIYLKNNQMSVNKNIRESNASSSVKSFLKDARSSKIFNNSGFNFRQTQTTKSNFHQNKNKFKPTSYQQIAISKELFNQKKQGAISQRKPQIVEEQDNHSLESPPKLELQLSNSYEKSSSSFKNNGTEGDMLNTSGDALKNLISDINNMV